MKSVRSVMGRIELEVGDDTPADELRERLSRVFGIANYSEANRGPHAFDGLAAAILGDLGDREVSSFRVSATRSDKRLPFVSPQVEREVGGLIQEAKGWKVDLERPALTVPSRCLDGASTFSARAGRRRHAGRHRRASRACVGRYRLAGGRVSHDAARLSAPFIHFTATRSRRAPHRRKCGKSRRR